MVRIMAAVSLVALIAMLVGGWFVFLREDAYAWHGAELEGKPATDLALTDQHEKPFTLANYRGKVLVVYFGYTSCPDFCLTTMLDMMQVEDSLGADAERVEIVMVTVDPARDTPQRLAEYLEFYEPSFIGLSGDEQRTLQIARDYGVMASKQTPNPGSTNYLVDHSTALYAIDPEGNLALSWKYGTSPKDIAEDVQHLLND
jgi:protein SCO1/2